MAFLTRSSLLTVCLSLPAVSGTGFFFLAGAADGQRAADVRAVELFRVPHYSEGVVFDHDGNGYVSAGKRIVQFGLDGRNRTWAITGAPNGHKVLADGTHLVCDARHHAVLRLAADGRILGAAATECAGRPLRAPNDLTLDAANGGFYFTDPGGSGIENPTGTVHYVVDAMRVVDATQVEDTGGGAGTTTVLVDDGLAFPNGIALGGDGKKLYLAESRKNRVLVYDVLAPGRTGPRRLFARLPRKDASKGQIDNQPDGICLDEKGNLYVAHYGMREVQVLSPEGELIARLPGGNVTTSNVAFGGPARDRLFVTGGLGEESGRGGVFRLDLGVPGLVILPPRTTR